MRALFESIIDREAGIRGEPWAVVLAGGDGRRLEEESRRLYGYARPKQYCAYGGDETLIERTVRRALALVAEERIVVVINRTHRREAAECLASFPRVRIVEQPGNADTLPGLLLGVLSFLHAAPAAPVYVLPSDHHVDDTAAFARSLQAARSALESDSGRLVLLGASATEPEEGYGWIVPRGAAFRPWSGVASFREKPPLHEVTDLMAAGALLNTFVMVGRAATIARLCARRAPAWWTGLCAGFESQAVLDRVYQTLPKSNFSREVLEAELDALRVMPMHGVAWSDIGTPDRLQRAQESELTQLASK